MRATSSPDWTILAGYFATRPQLQIFPAGRRKTTAEGYFLGERKMPVFAVALSVVATSLSVATFVGVLDILHSTAISLI